MISRAAALTVSYHHNRADLQARFQPEDSEDALVNTAQWFTRDEPLQGFNTQREFPRGKSAFREDAARGGDGRDISRAK